MRLLLPLLTLFTLNSYADEPCYRIRDCIEVASELSNKDYFYNYSDINKNSKIVGLEMNEANVDLLISRLLFTNGYARIPTENGYQVIPSRNIRNFPVPIIDTQHDKVPNSHDYMMAAISLKHIDAKEINRSFRAFMTPNGRIIPLPYAARILIMDTATNIRRLQSLIKQVDIPKNKSKRKG